MKPGDAVLVEAMLELVSADDEPLAHIKTEPHGVMGLVAFAACHALPDEATRRRAAELAADWEACAEGARQTVADCSEEYRETYPAQFAHFVAEVAECEVTARALRLLAGNAAEDKPAAHHPEGCDCGGFDRNGSHEAGEYVGFCIAQQPAAQSADAEGQGP